MENFNFCAVILPNRHYTSDYLGAQIKCAVARCCHATNRNGVFENIFSCKCFYVQVPTLDVMSVVCVGQKNNVTLTLFVANSVWTLPLSLAFLWKVKFPRSLEENLPLL